MGPDLTKLTKDMTPEDWVTAVLEPSKQIEKKFAQVNVLTADDEILTGIRISEDDESIVLRNVADPNPIKISKEDIEAIKESKTSMMPAGLVKSLKSRQEFDDLMKYLIGLKK